MATTTKLHFALTLTLTLLPLLTTAQVPTDDTMPTATDPATNTSPNSGVSLANYYLVFLALVACAICLAALLFWKRKHRSPAAHHHQRESALQRDLSAWEPAGRRRYCQPRTRWRSTELSREEGLNENGEAPPPYAPKTEPAVPLGTLSREQVGLKPPEYAEATVYPVGSEGRLSRTSVPSGSQWPPPSVGEWTGRSTDR